MADSCELIRGFLAKVLRAAADTVEGETRTVAEALCAAKADIDWHDPEARRAHLGELVRSARAVLAAVDGAEDPALCEAADLLGRVVDQDIEDGDDDEPQIRHGVARDRIVSHSDPEMRHGRKSASRRFDGHKLDLISDEDSELILGVEVRAGNAGDGEGAATAPEGRGLRPAVWFATHTARGRGCGDRVRGNTWRCGTPVPRPCISTVGTSRMRSATVSGFAVSSILAREACPPSR